MIISVAERLKNVEDYYFVKKLEEIAKLNADGKQVINFGIGSPDLAPSEETIEELVRVSSQATSHGYQPYRGIPEFRNKVSDWYKTTYNVDLNPQNEILPLMGSKEGILHLSMAFLNPGDKVLIPNPGYPTYTSNSKLIGAQILFYDLKEENGWFPSIEDLKKMPLEGVKLMWLNYPHMPTGTRVNIDKLKELVDFATKFQILICHDNPYSLVLNEEKPTSILSIPGAKEVAVELNSFSKSFNMAGWRIGMMVGNADYLAAALRVKSNVDSGMFLALQKAAIKALDNSDQWHTKRNTIYKNRRTVVYQILDYLGFQYDRHQTGLFVWAKAPETLKDIPAYVDKILNQAYVFITPGEIFGSNGARFIRLSLCVPEEKMKEAFERLKKFGDFN